MTGEYRDPILDRSPLSSPARRDSFNSSAITSGSARDSLPYPPAPSSPSRSEQSTSWRDRLAALNLEDEHESEQRRDSKGSDEPVIRSNGQGRTTIRMPMGVEEDSEDDAVRVPSNAVRAGQEETEWEEEDQVSTRPPPTTSEALKPAPPPKPAFPRPSSSTSAASPAYQPSSPARSFPRPSSPLKQSTSLPRPPSTANTTTSAIPGSSPLPPLGRSSTPARPFNPTANLGLLAKSQGGSDGCRRCGTAVYFAEKVMASGHKWHKRCLRCAGCSKALDSHLVERENLPYCKRCYDDNWGMKSQGFVLVRAGNCTLYCILRLTIRSINFSLAAWSTLTPFAMPLSYSASISTINY